MKSSEMIIGHLKSTNTYSKLNQQTAFSALIKMLPQRLSSSILFLYTKNGTLFLALKHPAMLMEFNYNLTLIKELLKKGSEYYPTLAEIKDVKGFVSYKAKDEDDGISHSIPFYIERSSGDFASHIEDKKIETLINSIKNIIKKK